MSETRTVATLIRLLYGTSVSGVLAEYNQHLRSVRQILHEANRCRPVYMINGLRQESVFTVADVKKDKYETPP
jgi:hypothetical protein